MIATAELGVTDVLAALTEARERTLHLIAAVGDEDLERVHSTLMSPLVWDLGHIAAFEDLWIVHRYGGRPLLREGLAEIYDAFETPRAGRGELDLLRAAEAREYLAQVRERTCEVLSERGPGDGVIAELILRHEHQHTETMLQTMELARLRGFTPLAPIDRGDATSPPAATGLEMVMIGAGACEIGAAGDGFAYDNERPRHRVELAGFQIGRTPVTNGTWRDWVAQGGYARREWWSSEGWAWRREEAIERPAGWSEDLRSEWRMGVREPLHPTRPVVHVSYHEAQAFATAHRARLPTEFEWEKAATVPPRS
jgi:iron(II)-dependent oxidoreductase